MSPQSRNRQIQIRLVVMIRNRQIPIHRAEAIIRMTLAVMSLSIRERAERITQMTQHLEATIRAEMIQAATMKRIPEEKYLRRKEAAAKWQISFRTAQYPFTRISNCP